MRAFSGGPGSLLGAMTWWACCLGTDGLDRMPGRCERWKGPTWEPHCPAQPVVGELFSALSTTLPAHCSLCWSQGEAQTPGALEASSLGIRDCWSCPELLGENEAKLGCGCKLAADDKGQRQASELGVARGQMEDPSQNPGKAP